MTRTPSILQPYLSLPPGFSITLLTSTLSCSATWVATRFIVNALVQNEEAISVIVVSWIRDEAFWRTEIKRTTGTSTHKPGTFFFVDRLAESTTRNTRDELQDLEAKIISIIERAGDRKVFVVLDTPELLLTLRPDLQVSQLNNTLLKIRAHPQVHSTLLSCMADLPCLSGDQRTALELATASFVISQAHISRSIFSVRELNTGSARDVSGLLRITSNTDDQTVREFESRYLVQRDGTVKMD